MKKYPKATPQDDLIEIFPDIYLLRGSIRIAPLLQMHRNMIVIREGHTLTLINAVRMHEQNLEALDLLGQVKHVIRLGDFHGLDDQFYLDRYGATLWGHQHHVHYTNLIPDQCITSDQIPPLSNSSFFIFEKAKLPEAALYLEQHQLLITTDSVQYWNDWKHTSFLSKIILSIMGFRLGVFIGGAWLKQVSQHKNSLKADFERLLRLDFKHLVAAHGNLRKNHAKIDLTSIVEKTFDAE